MLGTNATTQKNVSIVVLFRKANDEVSGVFMWM